MKCFLDFGMLKTIKQQIFPIIINIIIIMIINVLNISPADGSCVFPSHVNVWFKFATILSFELDHKAANIQIIYTIVPVMVYDSENNFFNSLTTKKQFSSANFPKMLSLNYNILGIQRLESKQCRYR